MNISDVAYPRQVVLASCRGHVKSDFSPETEKRDNAFTLSWHMPVSFDPELYAISVGKERFSLKLIRESKVFVINFMPLKLEKDILFCGRHSGRNIDKFKETGLEKEEAEKIDCCRIKQALACIECEVVQEIETGDHIIIIGKALKVVEKKKGKRIFQKQGGAVDFVTTE